MRKITDETAYNFKIGKQCTVGNTKVLGNSENTILTLHDNVIATKEGNKLLLTDSGWQTNTTKERLNGVLETFSSEWRIYQLKGQWYITDGMGQRKDWTGTLELTV